MFGEDVEFAWELEGSGELVSTASGENSVEFVGFEKLKGFFGVCGVGMWSCRGVRGKGKDSCFCVWIIDENRVKLRINEDKI